MKVLVDTPVWSLALRKKDKTKREKQIIEHLSGLIRDLHLVMVGPVRQEILSGIADSRRFEDLRSKISIFADFEIKTSDFELAARFYNECRKNGVQGSHIDFLLCAVASNNDFSIFTLDGDFTSYQKYIGIRLEQYELEEDGGRSG